MNIEKAMLSIEVSKEELFSKIPIGEFVEFHGEDVVLDEIDISTIRAYLKEQDIESYYDMEIDKEKDQQMLDGDEEDMEDMEAYLFDLGR